MSINDRNIVNINDAWSSHFVLYRLPLIRLGDFIIGIALAFLVFNSKPISNKASNALQLLSIVLFLIVAVPIYSQTSFLGALSFDLLWIPSFSLAIYSLSIPTLKKSTHFLSNKLFVSLGTWSFAFYLLHYLIYIQYSESFANNISVAVWINVLYKTTLILTIIILSWFSHKYIEVPAQIFLKKLFSKQRD